MQIEQLLNRYFGFQVKERNKIGQKTNIDHRLRGPKNEGKKKINKWLEY